MPSTEQLQKIWVLSDRVLYPEAVAFLHRLIEEKECSPLASAQVNGLLGVANSSNYAELMRYIKHQRERDWPERKKDTKIFYEELEKVFTTMKNKRVKDEFQLTSQGLSHREAMAEIDELMVVLTQDFIQHLIAENGLAAIKANAGRARR